MGAESGPGPFSETVSLGASWGPWHRGPGLQDPVVTVSVKSTSCPHKRVHS